MEAEDQPIIYEYCKVGHVTERVEEMTFRQWSDKGYIHCRVMIQSSSIRDPTRLFDEAFKREFACQPLPVADMPLC